MDSIRSRLYDNFNGLEPLFNPVRGKKKLPDPCVIDLTFDVANTSKVYHTKTDSVRDLLHQADLVITDTETLNAMVKPFCSNWVITLPYGLISVQDTPGESGLRVGLLNHDPDMEINNNGCIEILKRLDEEFLIFGSEISDLNAVYIDDFEQFAAQTDILILPSLPGSANSTTVPLAVMSAGTVVIASSAGGYNGLRGGPGVQMMPANRDNPQLWREKLQWAVQSPNRLQQMKEFSIKKAINDSHNSLEQLRVIMGRLPGLLEKKKSRIPVAVVAPIEEPEAESEV